MKKIILLGFIIALKVTALEAAEIRVSSSPQSPVMGEVFELLFEITTDSQETPFISFNPTHATVLGRESRGVSISTRMVGGQFSTQRTLRYAYQVISENAGTLFIRDIEVDIAGEKHNVADLRINVLRESPRPRDIFAKVKVSDDDVFLGQGVDVKYYLYYRSSIVGREIEQFPRLDNMIKRIHLPGRDSVETVEYQGQIYRRMYVYGARVFPNREGRVFVDPIVMRVQYTRERPGSAPFGMRSREYATQSVRSEQVEIKVSPLPSENVPSSFTGLVGEHSFELSTIHDRHLVNEPIEFNLKVTGAGALEEFSAPVLYREDFLEQFDVRSSVQELSFSEAQKVFEYVYLGRSAGSAENEKVNFSYFDYHKGEYVEITLNLPSFVVDGAAGSSAQLSGDNERRDVEQRERTVARKLLAPQFRAHESFIGRNVIIYANGALIFSSLVLVLLRVVRETQFILTKFQKNKIIDKMTKEGVEYHDLYQLLSADQKRDNGVSAKEIISRSNLPSELKGYFYELLEEVEAFEFSSLKGQKRPLLDKKRGRDLMRHLKGEYEDSNEYS